MKLKAVRIKTTETKFLLSLHTHTAAQNTHKNTHRTATSCQEPSRLWTHCDMTFQIATVWVWSELSKFPLVSFRVLSSASCFRFPSVWFISASCRYTVVSWICKCVFTLFHVTQEADLLNTHSDILFRIQVYRQHLSCVKFLQDVFGDERLHTLQLQIFEVGRPLVRVMIDN